MKTFFVIVKKTDKGLSLTSPSGKTINVTDSQLDNGTMSQILTFRKLARNVGTIELTVNEMQSMLDASKLPEPKLTGETEFIFSKFGKYYPSVIKIQNKNHEENYINKMEKKGFKLVGMQKV